MPDRAGSHGTLDLRGSSNLVAFAWSGVDPMLGIMNTGFLRASTWDWQVRNDACPEQLRFSGRWNQLVFDGTAILEATYPHRLQVVLDISPVGGGPILARYYLTASP
jgi:hypothetical protein